MFKTKQNKTIYIYINYFINNYKNILLLYQRVYRQLTNAPVFFLSKKSVVEEKLKSNYNDNLIAFIKKERRTKCIKFIFIILDEKEKYKDKVKEIKN